MTPPAVAPAQMAVVCISHHLLVFLEGGYRSRWVAGAPQLLSLVHLVNLIILIFYAIYAVSYM